MMSNAMDHTMNDVMSVKYRLNFRSGTEFKERMNLPTCQVNTDMLRKLSQRNTYHLRREILLYM